MPYLPHKESVGLVCRVGQNRRASLERFLGSAAGGKRLALVYLGVWGYPLPYEHAEEIRGLAFSFPRPPPPVSAPNWSVVPRDLMEHPDLVASVDLVVSKPGYGMAAECLAAGTPLLYCPRPAVRRICRAPSKTCGLGRRILCFCGGFFIIALGKSLVCAA